MAVERQALRYLITMCLAILAIVLSPTTSFKRGWCFNIPLRFAACLSLPSIVLLVEWLCSVLTECFGVGSRG